MNKNVKKWLNALKSGKYKRTTDRLKNGSAFCCLGVACDLYAKEKNLNWSKRPDEEYQFLNAETELPSRVRAWLGLRTKDGAFSKKLKINGEDYSLAMLNDSGWSFKKIADFIGKKPKGLFRG